MFRRCSWVWVLLGLITGLLLALVLPFGFILLLLAGAAVVLWLWNCRR